MTTGYNFSPDFLSAGLNPKSIYHTILSELEISKSPHEIIRIRIYSFQIGMPPDAPKPSNLDVDLLNHGDPIAFLNIYVKDLIKFGSYTPLEPQKGYTILNSHEDCPIESVLPTVF